MLPAGSQKWILIPAPRPAAALRLVCFHHAGGGAFAYRDWAARMSPQIELHALQLPGRETRADEPCAEDLPQLVEDIATVLETQLRPPFALFGHSLGALLAYKVACRLRDRAVLPPPLRLFLSAAKPPKPYVSTPAREASDEALAGHLRALGGTSEAALGETGLLDSLLPILRSDYRLLAACDLPADPVLDVPFSLIRGASDPSVKPERAAQWRALTRRQVREHVMPAGHFYPPALLPGLFDLIGDSLAMDLDLAVDAPA